MCVENKWRLPSDDIRYMLNFWQVFMFEVVWKIFKKLIFNMGEQMFQVFQTRLGG